MIRVDLFKFHLKQELYFTLFNGVPLLQTKIFYFIFSFSYSKFEIIKEKIMKDVRLNYFMFF